MRMRRRLAYRISRGDTWPLVSIGLVAVALGCDLGAYLPDPDGVNDCLPQGQRLCGQIWDLDGDTISTNTETNEANHTSHGGFYTFNTSAWDLNLSQARGIALGGSLFKGMNLFDQGTAYLHHRGCESFDVDDWGTGHLVRLIEFAGRWWLDLRAHATAMQVGDLSKKEGGFFGGTGEFNCNENHAYHRQGLDVDIRYLRADHLEGLLNICEQPDDYDNFATAELISSFLGAEHRDDANTIIDSIFVDMNCVLISDTTRQGRRILFHRGGHQDHFHVRIRDPDGPNN